MVEKAEFSDLKSVYLSFTAQKPDMDNKQFAKMCKDTKILDKKVTTTDVDITFTKYWNKTTKKINYEGLQKIIADFAKKKGVTYEQLADLMGKASGPVYSGTKADKVKLHDDKSSYTGVYAQGGPSTIDSTAGGLAGHLDRGDADVRGVKK